MEPHLTKKTIELAEPLTRRELEILALLAAGRSNAEIAEGLSLALSSVKWYAQQIYGKLVVENRKQAVAKARELGILAGAERRVELAPALPTGTVTFLFTDIENSTTLWEQMPEVMRAAVAQQVAILREAITAYGGQIFQVVRDEVQAAFRLSLSGLSAALAAQRALRDAQWGATGPLKVRIGLHTGPAELDNGVEGAYQVGLTLNRAARLAFAGHGGQVLLTREAADLVERDLPEGVTLLDLGQHRLKGLQHLEHLYQVVAPDLPHHFPPLDSGAAYPHNLPRQLTSFIGREKEIAELEELFLNRTARLVTLTGSGGTGKTRLALKAAETLLQLFPQGVWLVELAPVCDPELIPRAVAEVLGVAGNPQHSLTQALANYLRNRQLLLILDNCEHVVGEAGALAEYLLQTCPQLQILATSREILGVAGETPIRCPSLSLPHGKAGLDELAQVEAVSLFVERAQTVAASFELTESNAELVARICQRLDGIPLAIELAAARTRMLSLDQISARLDQAFRLLTGGSRSALPHHQTLKALIDWSYNLLSAEERALLVRLSVFTGGWTLGAAEEVCADREGGVQGSGDLLLREQILDLLGQLLDKSLIQVEQGPGEEPRYRMLEVVRQYAHERLVEGGRAEVLREHHLDYFHDLALHVQRIIRSSEIRHWLDTLERELDNLRLALEWSLSGSYEKGMRLAAALHWFWYMRDHGAEGLDWLEKLLAADAAARDDAQPPSQAHQAARGRALNICNCLAVDAVLGDPAEARERSLASQAIFQKLAEESGPELRDVYRREQAIARFYMAASLQEFFDLRRAFQELHDPFDTAECNQKIAVWFFYQSDFDQAAVYNEENLALRKEIGDIDGEGFGVFLSAILAGSRGNHALAIELAYQSLGFMERVGNRIAREFPSSILRLFLMAQGEYQQVLERAEIDRTLGEELNSRMLLLDALSYEAFAAWALGDYERAVLCAGKALEAAGDLPFTWRKLALYVLGRVDLSRGETTRAREYLLLALTPAVITQMFNDFRAVQAIGVLAAAQGQHRRAVLLFGAQAGLAAWTLNLMCPAERSAYEQGLAGARAGLGEDGFTEAWKEGEALSEEQTRTIAAENPKN